MSCKNKAADPIFDTFDHFVSQSDKVIIDFKDSNKKDSIISLSEIKKIRGIIKESKKSEDWVMYQFENICLFG